MLVVLERSERRVFLVWVPCGKIVGILGTLLSCSALLDVSIDAGGVNLLVRGEMDLEWERLVGHLLVDGGRGLDC
jgi:hypothetical protein